MLRKLLVSALILAFMGCARTFTAQDEVAIRAVMMDQEKAWDQGDIPAFMDGYSDSVCFITSKGRTCGKQLVTEHYLQRYPDKAAMGDLEFMKMEVLGAGADHAWCTGQWELRRALDTLTGGFSLLWMKGPEGWRIVRDHTY